MALQDHQNFAGSGLQGAETWTELLELLGHLALYSSPCRGYVHFLSVPRHEIRHPDFRTRSSACLASRKANYL